MSKEHPSILILDTYYPEFLKSAPLVGLGSYEAELAALMRRCFGTYDCYSRGLTGLGWDTRDFIANHRQLNIMNDGVEPIRDVYFYQDLNHVKNMRFSPHVMAGQISCAWPGDDIIKRFDILFTSFPHYLERIEKLGVKAVYLPLAFDPVVYERLGILLPRIRQFDCSFVGGLARQFNAKGLLDIVAGELGDSFHIYGYGNPNYMSVWGLEMYQVYAASKIVLNRHHPAAERYSNNLRMYEATGMGALLLTESSPNLHTLFEPGVECVTYTSPADAVDKIRYYLAHDDERIAIAAAGKTRTLSSHTYTHRLPLVDKELRGLL